MANTFLTPSVIAREALMILENNLVFANLVHRDYASEFTASKVGDTVTIRKPATFTAQEFSTTITEQDATETSTSLQLEKHFDVSFAVTAKDWTLELEQFSAQLIQPAVVALAQAIDSYCADQYVGSYSYVGTAGDPPDALLDIADIDKEMNENQVPNAGRFIIVNPTAKRDLFNIAQFTDADKRGDQGTALRNASMGSFMGLDWFMDQNIKSHTAGTGASMQTAATAVAGASSVAIDTGTGTLVVGDLVTIADTVGTYRVTTAVADVSSGTLAVDPPFEAAVGDNKAVTLVASHAGNLAMTRGAMALATVPLDLPNGAANAFMMADRGIGIRYVSTYNSTSKKDVISLDLLCGAKMIDGRLATRVLG